MKPWERLLEEKSRGLRIAWWYPYQEGGGIKGTLGASSAAENKQGTGVQMAHKAKGAESLPMRRKLSS